MVNYEDLTRIEIIPKIAEEEEPYFHISREGKHILELSKEYPLMLNCFQFSIEHPFTPNYHDYYEITFIYKGVGAFRIENEEYKVKQGDIIIIGENQMHQLSASHKNPLVVICIYFLPYIVFKSGNGLFDSDYIRIFYDINCIYGKNINTDAILELIKKLYLVNKEQKKYFQIESKIYLHEILLFLLKNTDKISTSNNKQYKRMSLKINRLKGVFKLIEEHYQERITLDKTASIACMSRSHFCRFFKEVTGYTLTQYLHRLRIDKSKDLLLRSNLSIIEIAYEVGFENLSYFYKIFLKLTHITPRNFRYISKKPRQINF